MATNFETEVCSRCLGTGHYSFNGEHSRCYKCDGKNNGMAYTKRGLAAKEYYEAKFQVPALEIKVGDKVRQMPYIRQLTVAKIEVSMPTSRSFRNGVEVAKVERVTFTNDAGFQMWVSVDEAVSVLPTVEQKEAALRDALAYQDTLTKQGTQKKR